MFRIRHSTEDYNTDPDHVRIKLHLDPDPNLGCKKENEKNYGKRLPRNFSQMANLKNFLEQQKCLTFLKILFNQDPHLPSRSGSYTLRIIIHIFRRAHDSRGVGVLHFGSKKAEQAALPGQRHSRLHRARRVRRLRHRKASEISTLQQKF